ncbi:MAG: flagellar hook-associated protein FlgK [Alphaproteobacteria bacterium]|nr:flagellar hook-associated protein FlgK [Alphaproteobacteria bacterium]
MGISSILTSALSGLHVNEHEIELISRNISNARTPGYTRKVLNRESTFNTNDAISVRAGTVSRRLNEFLQEDLRSSNTELSYANVVKEGLEQIDLLFGKPDGELSLNKVYHRVTSALERLSATPGSAIMRREVADAGKLMAQQLNQISSEIQRLRSRSNRAIGIAVKDLNNALNQLEKVNIDILKVTTGTDKSPDILDVRDREIDRIAQFIDVRVFGQDNGSVSLFTDSGISLFDHSGARLSFDDHGVVGFASSYDTDPNQRTIGTASINMHRPGGSIDLLRPGVLRSGAIAGHAMLRDKILPRLQEQMDDLAYALATSFSQREVKGSPVTIGEREGFEVDLSTLSPGDHFQISFTDSVHDKPSAMKFIRVDDPASAGLLDDHTKGKGKENITIAVDFSNGIFSAAKTIDSFLGESVDVFSQGDGLVRFLGGEGVSGLSHINSFSAYVTETRLASGHPALPLFVTHGEGGSYYTDRLDKYPQHRGFAEQIAFNPDVDKDLSKLVVFSPNLNTLVGDPTRPRFLASKLSASMPDMGIHIKFNGAPYSGTIGNYLDQIIDSQSRDSFSARQVLNSKKVVNDVLQKRFDEDSSVNLDRELGQLLLLQNAFSANARILRTVEELFQKLMEI